jgi:hypothetical protein
MAQNSAQGNVQSVDPGVNDDCTVGFAVGAGWYNSATGAEYRCKSNAVGAAVWDKIGDGEGASVGTALVAAGTIQSDALLLSKDINILGTVASSTGVRLAAGAKPGYRVIVKNRGANTVNIWPATGGKINAGSANAAITAAAGAVVELVCITGDEYEAI